MVRPVPLVLRVLLPEGNVEFWFSCHGDLQLSCREQPQNLSDTIEARFAYLAG